MAKHSLTQRRVENAKPRREQYQIPDRKIKGLFLRVYGLKGGDGGEGRKSWFLRITHHGEKHFIHIGDAATISLTEARKAAEGHIERIRTPVNSVALFEHVAEEVFERYGNRKWKPSTHAVNRKYYRLYIKPHFAGWAIDSITHSAVQAWVSSLAATPASANRARPILSVILREAAKYGYRPEGDNPCDGIRTFRRPKREKHLTEAEIAQLGAVLREYEGDFPAIVAIIRLILLTGCRGGEIMSLQWRWYRDGCLHLPDTKTGPQIIYLSAPARAVMAALREQRKPRAKYVFPTRLPYAKSASVRKINHTWHNIRREAGLDDLRLHDLRHTYASHALRIGENIRVISRLLGHANPDVTMRYLHIADSNMCEAVAYINKTMLNPED